MGVGNLPEYVPITQLFDFYKILTEANQKNRSISTHLSEDQLVYDNIKNDVVLIQFKLVSDCQTLNTISFVNLHCDSQDINATNLNKVFQSMKQPGEFVPYNKSILTRILYE